MEERKTAKFSPHHSSTPFSYSLEREVTAGSDGKPHWAAGPAAFWGWAEVCIGFHRDHENWVNSEKLANSIGQYSHGSPCLSVQLIFFLKEKLALDFGKLFSCHGGNVMGDDMK